MLVKYTTTREARKPWHFKEMPSYHPIFSPAHLRKLIGVFCTQLVLSQRKWQPPISQPLINQATIMTKNKASNIHFAAQIGDLTTIQRAIKKDKSVLGVTNANGWTPLHESARKLSDTCLKPEQTSMPRQMVVVAVQSCGWPSKVLERITNLFRTSKVWVHWMLVQICNSRYDTFVFVTTNVTKCENRK
jgi:hypothetical protein